MIRIVLVATDGSEAAEVAVRTASELTLSLGPDAYLHIAGVVHYADVPGMLGKRPAGAPDLLGDEIAEALEAATAIARSTGVAFEVHRVEGEVVESILACAEAVKADILVAGALGRNRLARLVLGSITEKLVRSTNLPVVVVHRVTGNEAPEAAAP
jgi:nucleotide-binding universal stress UspA family protein